jgi:hypothetical protein
VAQEGQIYEVEALDVTPEVEDAQQFEVPLGPQSVQEESLHTYNFTVSPSSRSEEVELKIIVDPPSCGSGESETSVMVG